MNPIPPGIERKNDYPTTDGRPMAETDLHRNLMIALLETVAAYFSDDPAAYVSGNLLVFYERENRRRHVSPDVFVALAAGKHDRPNYLLWEEEPIDVVIELTSSSTRREDTEDKLALYQDVLKVKEYFLFDPQGEYLDPTLQGYRLRAGRYRTIRLRQGRLPSQTLGLHLEQAGDQLRLYDPATGQWLPTPAERTARAEQETERLRREIAELRRRLEGGE